MNPATFRCKWIGDPKNSTFDVTLTPEDIDAASLLDQNLWHLAAEGFVTAVYDYFAMKWEDMEIVRVETVSEAGEKRIFDVRQKREVTAAVVNEVEPVG